MGLFDAVFSAGMLLTAYLLLFSSLGWGRRGRRAQRAVRLVVGRACAVRSNI